MSDWDAAQLDGNEAAQYRIVKIKNALTGIVDQYLGDQVYSISSLGIVIAYNQLRMLVPWHNVFEFTYHNNDVPARKIIQGF